MHATQAEQVYASHTKVRVAVQQLKLQLTHGTGLCQHCHVNLATDIDHMRPATKGMRFAKIASMVLFDAEVAANTASDGTILLQALCADCHRKKTWSTEVPRVLKPKQQQYTDLVNAYKLQQRHCVYAHCVTPQIVCTPANLMSFDLDHQHVQDCQCGSTDCFPKVANISAMLREPGLWTVQQLQDELSKTQLMHSCCHRWHTVEQLKYRSSYGELERVKLMAAEVRQQQLGAATSSSFVPAMSPPPQPVAALLSVEPAAPRTMQQTGPFINAVHHAPPEDQRPPCTEDSHCSEYPFCHHL